MTEEKANLDHWKRLLASLESAGNKVQVEDLKELEKVFRHLSPQTAVRHQRDYESSTQTSENLFDQLFDRMDLADKPLLCSYLEMLKAFAYFRLAQITYRVESINDTDCPIYSPTFVKSKWYDMVPLLPKAGDLGWKNVMNHGLVKEEKEMFPICFDLLKFKLHSSAIIVKLSRLQESKDIVLRNGKKLAKKFFELIKDAAYDDESTIDLVDVTMFELLMPFIDEKQQATLVETVVHNLFKLHIIQKTSDNQTCIDSDLERILYLIKCCIIDRPYLQDILFNELLTNFKINVIRRKRRHSIESASENESSTPAISLEGLVEEIRSSNGKALLNSMELTSDLELTKKSLQSNYISYWVDVVDKVIDQGTLMHKSTLRILGTCSLLLASASSIMKKDLIYSLSKLMSNTIEKTAQNKLFQVFEYFNPSTLIDLTKILSTKSDLISTFDTPIVQFYKSFLNRYLRGNLFRTHKKGLQDLNSYVEFVCDKSLLSKDTARLLQYVCLHQMAECMLEFKSKTNSMAKQEYMNCVRSCSTHLYKSIKRYALTKVAENGVESADETQEIEDNESKRSVIIEALVCILVIATDRADQELLDKYGGLLLRLYDALCSRIARLIDIVQHKASNYESDPLDLHITKLLQLYIKHKDKINIYLNYDVLEKILDLLKMEPKMNGYAQDEKDKRVVYKQVKAKLEELGEKAKHSQDVYPMIINKQYSAVVEPSIGSLGDIRKERPCFYNFSSELRTLKEVRELIISNSKAAAYKNLIENTVYWLENCDPLDHAKVLYLLLMLESSIPSYTIEDAAVHSIFRKLLPRIGCSLVRITKSVEFGPSIHAFKNPGQHRSNKGVQCCTYSKCITIYTIIFARCPPQTTSSIIADALELCVSANLIQYAKYSTRLHKFFIQLASSISGLLLRMSLARKESDTLDHSMPTFLELVSHLVRCIIMASDRQKLEQMPKNNQLTNGGGDNGKDNDKSDDDGEEDEQNANEAFSNYETRLKLLAIDIGRTLNNLSLLRVKMVEYAPHLIAAYIKDVKRAPCPDFVRVHLEEAIFRIFNLIDAHQKERQEELVGAGVQRKTNAGRAKGSLFEMIHARLDQASREIFKDLHDNYNSLHRYRAKC